jgi:hypothetical protein
MSEENLPLEFKEMSDAYAEPPKEEKTYTTDMSGIEGAANELEETRAAEKDIIERKYIEVGGERHGQDMPRDQSIDLQRAVDDITRQRGFEAEAAEEQGAETLRNEVDAYRASEQAKLQQQQQPQQAHPEPQPQPQIPPDQIPDGVDIEVVQALQNSPKLRLAVEQELGKANQAREAYAVATQQAAQVALAAVLANYPEIQGLSADQLPTALQVMAGQNPQRAADAVASLQRAEQIYRLHQQAQGAQAQVMQAQLQHWQKSEDSKMDSFIATEPPETVRAVKDNLIKVAAEVYGISKDELAHAFATTPILRAAPFQRMLYDLVKTHTARAQAADKMVRTAPPFMRPGTSDNQPSGDDAQIARAHKVFLANPNPKNASAFILAKRNARR